MEHLTKMTKGYENVTISRSELLGLSRVIDTSCYVVQREVALIAFVGSVRIIVRHPRKMVGLRGLYAVPRCLTLRG